MKQSFFDVIIVGGGHAGNEAAFICSKLNLNTLLITSNINTIGQMSCNPAMGGVAKGQIVREIDILGGNSARVTDLSALQYKLLNKSKGPAMWSPRAQCDKYTFPSIWRQDLESLEHLSIFQDSVNKLILEGDRVKGVETKLGLSFHSKAVILTNGTFLNGVIHIGLNNFSGGRLAEPPSLGLSDQLKDFNFTTGRLKTGTPARVKNSTVDFSAFIEQPGDKEIFSFRYFHQPVLRLDEQISCHMAYTNPDVHDIIYNSVDKSPLFSGKIKGTGPRYCPSIEDKVFRFNDKERHQIFVEPESRYSNELYLNGLSTSLPLEIQYKVLHQMKGFENVQITRPGYAIEYDYIEPYQLHHTLETKSIHGLYLAGQINGTTGYEEAAAQGLMAGINASLKILNKEPLILKRSEAYIGVLIDDLVTKSTKEPYRMFTSRAEFRLILRQDNADQRLLEKAHNIGLCSIEKLEIYQKKISNIDTLTNYIKTTNYTPSIINSFLKSNNSSLIKEPQRIAQLVSRPEISLPLIFNSNIDGKLKAYSYEEIEQVDIHIKYQHYFDKQNELIQKFNHLEQILIPLNMDYDKIKSLSTEGKQKLKKYTPKNLEQAKGISGISMSDIQILMIYLGK